MLSSGSQRILLGFKASKHNYSGHSNLAYIVFVPKIGTRWRMTSAQDTVARLARLRLRWVTTCEEYAKRYRKLTLEVFWPMVGYWLISSDFTLGVYS